MKDDWRWVAAVLLYLAVPIYGISHCVKHYQIRHNVRHVAISDIPNRVTEDLQQFEINDFEIYGNEDSKSRIVCVAQPESPDDDPAVVVLFCSYSSDPQKSFDDINSSGVAKGLITSSQTISKKWAFEEGWDLPDVAAERIFYIHADRDYFDSTAIIAIAFTLICLIPLAWVYMELEERRFKDSVAANNVTSSVALQVELAKQATYRY